MVESFNGPFEPVDPPEPTRWDRFKARIPQGDGPHVYVYTIIGLSMVVLALLVYLVFYSSNEKRVVLTDKDFYCSQQTAQKRFSFSAVETCDQYTRKVEVNRWSK